MQLPPDYQDKLRRTAPAGTSAVLKTENLTLATGKLRAGDRPGVLEFVMDIPLASEVPLENATMIRNIGALRDMEFTLDHPPKWNAALDCWDLEFLS